MGLGKAGQITEQQFAECVEAITGFIFRRYACGETSRTYAKWFVAACKDIAGDDVPGELLQFLVERGYPGDARFQKALCRFPLYEGKYAFAEFWCVSATVSSWDCRASQESRQLLNRCTG